MPTYNPIGDEFDNVDWSTVVVPYDDWITLPYYNPADERGQRFATEEEAVLFALEIGVAWFSHVIEYPDSTYGIAVSYDEFT